MKKFCLAPLLVLALALGIAACGSKGPIAGGNTTTTAPPPSETLPVTAPAPDPTTSKEQTTENKPAADPETKQQAIQIYSAAVEKILKANPTIRKTCVTSIKRPLEGDDGAKKLLKLKIGGYGVEKTVCGDLFGEGSHPYTQTAKEALQPCWLEEDDITGFTFQTLPNGDVLLTISVKNCINPLKPWYNQGSSPLGSFTWDFTNIQSIEDGVKEAEKTLPGLKISVGKKTVSYSNIQIKATIRPDGGFASLVHSFNFSARAEDVEVRLFAVRMGGGSYIQGTATGTVTYTF